VDTLKAIKIPFTFKPFNQLNILPKSEAFFKVGETQVRFMCLVDSGADFCTLPFPLARESFNIDLKDKIAPNELRKEYKEMDKSNKKELNNFIKRFLRKDCSLPIEIVCACGNTTIGYLYPAEIQIGKFENKIPLLFLGNERKGIVLIGRFGVFDYFDEVVFKAKTDLGYFIKK